MKATKVMSLIGGTISGVIVPLGVGWIVILSGADFTWEIALGLFGSFLVAGYLLRPPKR